MVKKSGSKRSENSAVRTLEQKIKRMKNDFFLLASLPIKLYVFVNFCVKLL